MKKLIAILFAVLTMAAFALAGCGGTVGSGNLPDGGDGVTEGGDGVNEDAGGAAQGGGDILIVYFSATGNTQQVAEYIAAATGGTLWEIEAADPYTEEGLEYYTGGRADQEQDDESCRPEIAGAVADFAQYDTVFIGHPIWHGIAPRIIQTFIESYNFTDKDVYTFSTSASSSGSGAFNALAREYASINLVENIHFTSRTLSDAQTSVNEWIAELGLAA